MRTKTIPLGLIGLLFGMLSAAALAAGTAPSAATSAASAPAAASVVTVAPATTLAPQPRQVLIGRTVVAVMQMHHYPAEKLDPKLAHNLLKQYFDALDPNRFFFTEGDINRFLKYESTLAGDLKHGNLKPAYAIYNTYGKAANRQLHYALGLLAKKPALNAQGNFRFSRRHAPWAQNQAALNRLWRERVDNDVLSLLLAGKSWPQARKILTKRYRHALNHINRTHSNDAFEAWMNAYAQTEDPHSSYFSPFDAQQFKIAMSLQLQGVGAQLSERDNYITVVKVIPGGPAAESKALKAGDRIVGVGEGKSGKTKDVIGWRLDDVVKMIRGHKGSTVRLKILPAGAPPGGAEKTISLVRNTIKLNAEHAHARVALVKQGNVAYKVGVITIPSFYLNFNAESHGNRHYASVSHDVAALLKILKKKQVSGILLDLRNNGGGSLQEASALTGLFVPGGPVVQVKDRSGQVQVLGTRPDEKVAWRGPLAVLVNRFSASATEIFTGALKDYHRALVIGSDTWGKGTVQQLIQLDHYLPGFKAGELKLTTAQFFRINGASTQRRGVKPEIAIPNAINDDKFGESSLPNALPWKRIDAADYKPVHDGLSKALPKIKHYFDDTLTKRPAFQLYLKQTDAQRTQAAQTQVSLNFKTRKTKRAARRAQELALANAWRKLAGKKPFKSLKAADNSNFNSPDVPLETSAQLLGEYIGVSPSIAGGRKPSKLRLTNVKSECFSRLSPHALVGFCWKDHLHKGKKKVIYPPSARTGTTAKKGNT